MEIEAVSKRMAEAAEAGQWERVSHLLWQRADLIDGLRDEDGTALRAAHTAGERVRAAAQRLRAELQTELHNLRASRRSAAAWRPYREPSGGFVDLSS